MVFPPKLSFWPPILRAAIPLGARPRAHLSVDLYWWCPLVWWAQRELREAEEECCDAWVLWALPGSAARYAHALVRYRGFSIRSTAGVEPRRQRVWAGALLAKEVDDDHARTNARGP